MENAQVLRKSGVFLLDDLNAAVDGFHITFQQWIIQGMHLICGTNQILIQELTTMGMRIGSRKKKSYPCNYVDKRKCDI